VKNCGAEWKSVKLNSGKEEKRKKVAYEEVKLTDAFKLPHEDQAVRQYILRIY
jgi:hypothetical protein